MTKLLLHLLDLLLAIAGKRKPKPPRDDRQQEIERRHRRNRR